MAAPSVHGVDDGVSGSNGPAWTQAIQRPSTLENNGIPRDQTVRYWRTHGLSTIDPIYNDWWTYSQAGYLWIPFRREYTYNPAGEDHRDLITETDASQGAGSIKVVSYHAIPYPGTVQASGGTMPAGRFLSDSQLQAAQYPPAPVVQNGVVVNQADINQWKQFHPGGPGPATSTGGSIPLWNSGLPQLGAGGGSDQIMNLLLLSSLAGGQQGQKKRKKKVKYVQAPASQTSTYSGQGDYPGSSTGSQK